MTVLVQGHDTRLHSSPLSKVWSILGLRGTLALSRAAGPAHKTIAGHEHAKSVIPRATASPMEAALSDGRSDNVSEAARLGKVSTSYGLSESLNEHFDLGKVLGQGGNAIVVRAVSRHTGKEYACKCIRKVKARTPRCRCCLKQNLSTLLTSADLFLSRRNCGL